MGKHLLRSMLLTMLMVFSTVSSWGAQTADLSMDYTLAGYKAKAFYDFTSNVGSVLPETGDLRFRADFGLFNFGSGNRSGDAQISVTATDVLVCQFADTQGRSVTINSISGCTKSATLSDAAGHLFFEVDETAETLTFNVGRGGCVVSVLVMEQDTEASTADYTLNYVCSGETVKTISATGAVGGTVITDAAFFVDEVKYIRMDGEPENFTIAAGENVFTVNVRLAASFNYVLNDNFSATVTSGAGMEGETVYAPYPRYLLKDGVFYEAAATNKEYRKPIELTADNAVATVEYAVIENVNAVFFAEGENLDGVDVTETGNIIVRGSNALAATATGDVAITTLAPGKYVFHVGAFTSKSAYSDLFLKFGVGEETFSVTPANVNLSEVASEEFELKAKTAITFLGAESTLNIQFDYIWIEKTGDVEGPVDYTSYIVNADFASTGGWTEKVSESYRDFGFYQIGGEQMVRFAAPTADETHLNTEYAAGFEARWATSFASYIQTIAELPAGNYKLTYDVENVNANTAAAYYNNLFTVTVGEMVFMDESTEWMSDKTAWTQHTIRFTVEEAGPVTISFGYGTGENNFPASDTPALYVSHVKLNTYDPVADNKDELTEVITYAEALAADELKTEGVEEFADAISTAKYVLETATTAEELANAIDALRAAITTFTLANQFIWDGVVYIIDVETGKKMAAGHDWGTRGIVNDLGLDLTLVSDETTRTVTIDSRVSNGGQRHFLGSNLYMDSPAFGWILQYRGFGFYISNGTKYISLDENDNLVLSETPREWVLVTSDGVKEQLLSEMADATAESPVDATFFIKANNFNRNDWRNAESWTVSADCTNSKLSGGSDENNCAESYHSTFTISQTIEGLPAGVYKMTAQGFYRQDEALEEDAPVFFANDAVAALPAKAGEEDNMSDASAAFTSGLYTIEPIEFVVGEEGVVTLGVKNESATNQWIVFDNFQLTYYGAEQPEPVEDDLIEIALDVERYTGMGYSVTEASVDFAEAKEFLGVDEITYDMLRIVNPDDTEISDYAGYDGWFNAEGVATTWGDNTKICVKFFQAIADGKYEICDMNGADEVGKTYTVKWALVANDKKVFYTINVKFVEKPAIAITYDDLNIVETVTSDFSFEVGTCYQGSTATVDVAAILAELGVASLDDVTIYAVQSDKSLDDNYKLGTTDGWRNAAGDWQGWGSDACFYVKADFSAAESQLYQVGTMDPESNTNIAADDVYTAKYVFVKGDDAHSAVELDVVVTMTSAVGINGIALDAENSAVYDLTGCRVKNVVKGNLYIVNGKKVLVK